VSEQARAALEDVPVQVIKVGFVGSPENLSVVAGVSADYPDTPLIAYMPSLSWWDEVQIDLYLDAFKELILPQTTVLVGNHSTLWRWLLPDWSTERRPGARDIARAAHELGVPYTLVTGIPLPDQFIALAALLASGSDLSDAFTEALSYLDRCLEGGFRPGMGHIVPDRLFWAQPEDGPQAETDPVDISSPISLLELPSHDTKH
jgi:hydroxymethylpyrimidine/phosphomethylpyrimidine kinase